MVSPGRGFGTEPGSLSNRQQKRKEQQSTTERLRNVAASIAGTIAKIPETEMGRQLGLTGRIGAETVAAIPLLGGDFVNTLINLPLQGVNRVADTNIPLLEMPSAVARRGLDKVFPTPASTPERIVNVAGQALTGAGIARKGAQALTQRGIPLLKTPNTTQRSAPYEIRARQGLEEMATQPTAQTIGAGTGQLGVEGALAAGVTNPLALTGIALGAGAAGNVPTSVVNRASDIVTQPITKQGQKWIAGQVLLDQIQSDVDDVIPRLATADDIVPGSRRMTAGVSQDPGLASIERPIQNMETAVGLPGATAARRTEQSIAREEQLDKILPDIDEVALEQAQQKPPAIFANLKQNILPNATPVVGLGRTSDTNPILAVIDDIRASTTGKTPEMRTVMNRAKKIIENDEIDLTNAEEIYFSIRRPLATIRDGSMGQKPLTKEAGQELQKVIDKLDETIEPSMPGYRKYLKDYSQAKTDVDDIVALTNFRHKLYGGSAVNPVVGTPSILPSISQKIRRNLTQGANLRKRLTKKQLKTLEAVAQDIDESNFANTQQIAMPGSDTFKNISVAAMLGQLINKRTAELTQTTTAGKMAARTFGWLYQIPDEEITRIVANAMLEPKVAAALIKNASETNLETAANLLKRSAGKTTTASLLFGEEGI